MGRKSDLVAEMMQYCDSRLVMSFADLCDAMRAADLELFECLCKPDVATMMAEYIRARAPEYRRKKKDMLSKALAREFDEKFMQSAPRDSEPSSGN